MAETAGMGQIENEAEKELTKIEEQLAGKIEAQLAKMLRQALPKQNTGEQWHKDVWGSLMGSVKGIRAAQFKKLFLSLLDVEEVMDPDAWKIDAINGAPFFSVPYLSGGPLCQRLGAKRKDRTLINSATLGNYTSAAILEQRSRAATLNKDLFNNKNATDSKLLTLISEDAGQWRDVSSMLKQENKFEE